MSDNISADEVKRRLVIFLRIPAEVWTDIFKLLPRRVLVRKVSPVCYRFKEISNKNVKNIHVIKRATWFCFKLGLDDPEANQHLEHLADNKCELAGQFRLTKLSIRDEKSQAILRHCPDLFDGCQIKFIFNKENKSSAFFLDCLTELGMAKPVQISVDQYVDQVVDFWPHPTFQHCTRLELYFWSSLSAATATLTTASVNIYDWLHRRPTDDGMDSDGTGNAADQQVRSMIVWLHGRHSEHEHVDWLLDRCTQNLQRSQGPADRRPFVFSFKCQGWSGFGQFRRAENESTGEVLMLDLVMDVNGYGEETHRLRRCLAKEEANGKELYAEMFSRNYGYEHFKSIHNEIPEVMIG